MIRINIKTWKPFKPSDLFLFEPMPLKLGNKDLSDDGDVPVQSSKTTNNGIIGFTKVKARYNVSDKTPFYVVFGDHTRSFSFVDYSFNIMDNVKVLSPKKNKFLAYQFIAAVWKKGIKNLGYSRHWAIAKDTIINLPVKNNEPDWDYMEKYMKELTKKQKKKLTSLIKCSTIKKTIIDTSGWKDFEIGKLFHIKKPPVLHTKDVKESESGIDYVVRTKFNNGVKYKVNKREDIKPTTKGVISFGSENSSFFYQDSNFYSGRDIYYVDTTALTKRVCLFLAACLSTITEKYSYNYGLFPDLLAKEKIKLPVKNNEPDWDYMEKYMIEIEKKCKNKLNSIYRGTII